MKIQRFFLAAAGAAVFFIVVDTFLSPVVFPDGTSVFYRTPRSEPLAGAAAAAAVVSALLMAYMFPIGYKGGKHFAEGLRFGMLLGVLMSLPANLRLYAAAQVRLDSLLTIILWTIITWGIAGAIIAVLYGKTISTRDV